MLVCIHMFAYTQDGVCTWYASVQPFRCHNNGSQKVMSFLPGSASASSSRWQKTSRSRIPEARTKLGLDDTYSAGKLLKLRVLQISARSGRGDQKCLSCALHSLMFLQASLGIDDDPANPIIFLTRSIHHPSSLSFIRFAMSLLVSYPPGRIDIRYDVGRCCITYANTLL